jgi:hypothetical protein
MSSARFFLVAAFSLATLAGCPGVIDDSSSLRLVGVAGTDAYLEYAPEWSGFETLATSFWQLDLDTAKATRVYDKRVQYDLQLAGSYAVAERPAQDNQASEVVAKSVSSGDEIVILERDVKLGGHYDREFVVDGTNVVARTDAGLLVYDLFQQAEVKVIPVADELIEIDAAGAGWAIVTRNDVAESSLAISLETNAAQVIPEPPDGFHPLFFDAAIEDEYAYTAAFREESAGTPGNRLLALHIPTLTWSTLVDYGETRVVPWGDLLHVLGADATNVLAEVFSPFGGSRIELINRTSGQQTTIAREFTGVVVNPLLHNGQVYWLNGRQNELTVFDIAAGTRRRIPVPIPD